MDYEIINYDYIKINDLLAEISDPLVIGFILDKLKKEEVDLYSFNSGGKFFENLATSDELKQHFIEKGYIEERHYICPICEVEHKFILDTEENHRPQLYAVTGKFEHGCPYSELPLINGGQIENVKKVYRKICLLKQKTP